MLLMTADSLADNFITVKHADERAVNIDFIWFFFLFFFLLLFFLLSNKGVNFGLKRAFEKVCREAA